MDQDIKNELAEIKKRVKRMEQYLMWTLIITIVVVVLPAIGLIFVIPAFLQTFSEIGNIGL